MSLFTLPTRSEVDTATIVQKIKEPPKVKSTINLTLAIKEAESKVRQTLGAEAEGFSLITSDNEFIAYCKKAKEDGIVAIDTETTGLDSMLDTIVGVCMYSPSQKPMYAPINHISSITKEKLENQVSIEALKEGMKLLSKCKIIFHNAYFDIMIIYQATGIMLVAYWDTQIAGHLLNENESHSLKDLYAKYILNNQVDATYFNELFDGIPFCYIPPHVAVAYAAKDSIMTYKVFRFQERFLTAGTEECKEYGLEKMAKFHREELIPMIPVLVDMKLTGMEFDFEEAERLKEKYTKLKEEAVVDFNKSLEPFKDAIIENGMPYPLNYNSSQQIKKLFYNIAQIGVVYRKEPTGTGKNVREAILALDKFKGKPIRTVVECLTKVKEYDKVISTFIVKLAEDAKLHGGKIHANLNMSATVTGRLSSSQPNMQQVPAKMKDIRRMFAAGKGRVMISSDFSKQEPSCLSSVCKDPALIEVFHSGLDIYSKIASMIFNLPYEDCLEHNPDGTTNAEGKERRSVAKKVVLSILYSKGLKTLADDLHSDINKAQEVMDAVKAAYPVMAKWMDDTVKNACQVGYEDNLFGRRRRWPELLKPSYEFIFPKGTDESTITYQSAIFRGKLRRARFSEKFKVKQSIEAKGVRVIDNEAKQAEAKRQIVNFAIQSCLHGDSKILTKEHGIVAIKDIAGQNVTIWDGNNFVKAGCSYSGKKQLVKIHLRNNTTILSSLDHKFLFMDTRGAARFKTAKELSEMTGNSIMLALGGEVDNFDCLTKFDFPKLVETTAPNAHKYSFADIEDRFELGYLLGWLHSDGSISNSKDFKFLVAENKLAILPYLESIIKKYFKYAVHHQTAEEVQLQKPTLKITQSLTYITLSSKTLGCQALDMGVKHHIPDVVFKSKQAMRGFVRACLDADGTVLEGVTFTFGKVHFYDQLANELCTILSFFGIAARLHYCADRINVVVMKKDTEKFYSAFGCNHPQKRERILNLIEYVRQSTYGKKYPMFANTVRVKNVEITDELVDMYDIVNSESHKFITGGVVTHNCAAVITMRAMRKIYSNPRLKELGCKLVMSIHDEVLCTVPKQHMKEAVQLIEKCMLSSGDGLAVPLACDTEVSDRWYGEPMEVK